MFDLVRAKLESQIFYMGHYSKKAPSDMFHGIVNSLFHTPKYHAALNCITSWAKNQQKIDVSNVDDLLKKLEESDGEIKKIDAEIANENPELVGSAKAASIKWRRKEFGRGKWRFEFAPKHNCMPKGLKGTAENF
ncbi:hypothetical protein DdX_19418 [Ditylenchus destructor]|uniref:Uncharacterized protein n=1 Tax=Ditylenchus destructor TaxID=166010 RepID=A0AAD4MHR6_9BILA|nr:hypothetical protein DdX_19418 [Ditylenchus destructor]